MHWIAPSEKDTETTALEKSLWDVADQFRANSGLMAQEYSGPILGINFLRFAEVRFAAQRAKASASSCRGSRVDEPAAYHAEASASARECMVGFVLRMANKLVAWQQAAKPTNFDLRAVPPGVIEIVISPEKVVRRSAPSEGHGHWPEDWQ